MWGRSFLFSRREVQQKARKSPRMDHSMNWLKWLARLLLFVRYRFYSEGHIRPVCRQAGHQTSRPEAAASATRRPPNGPAPVLQKHTLILKFVTHYALELFLQRVPCIVFLGRKRKLEEEWARFVRCPLICISCSDFFFAFHFKREYQNLWFYFGSTALLARTF